MMVTKMWDDGDKMPDMIVMRECGRQGKHMTTKREKW